MLIKILGMIDIFAGLIFWAFGAFGVASLSGLVLLLGFVLLGKGVIFLIGLDFVSVLDVIFGILIIASGSFHMPIVVVIIVSLFLIQKGIFSLLG